MSVDTHIFEMSDTMGRLFARVSFVPSLIYTIAMEKISPRQWFNYIDANIILGALPMKGMTKQLVNEEKVNAVISMNEDYELKWLSNMTQEWSVVGVKFLQLSITDIFEAPCQEKLLEGVDFIKNLKSEKADARVYIHCKAGRTRSATLVGCYLMDKQRCSPEEAVEYMIEKRPHIWLREKQLEALKIFYQNNIKSKISENK
ncbi:unnamed protein product [Meganyctiphanes norvegica]|uniref:Phosphatidylglycerophosphatase and protein-tyrosine phosphatase 1 n=1 Tax=Meganyctiphanes norvegica TaxID=48144 RepID=A0AAV2Q8V5_MEGNR